MESVAAVWFVVVGTKILAEEIANMFRSREKKAERVYHERK